MRTANAITSSEGIYDINGLGLGNKLKMGWQGSGKAIEIPAKTEDGHLGDVYEIDSLTAYHLHQFCLKHGYGFHTEIGIHERKAFSIRHRDKTITFVLTGRSTVMCFREPAHE